MYFFRINLPSVQLQRRSKKFLLQMLLMMIMLFSRLMIAKNSALLISYGYFCYYCNCFSLYVFFYHSGE